MTVIYEKIVPWGRNFEEYKNMFSLTKEDLKKNILGCGDGPASFNAEGKERGYKIISIDPIYCFTKEEIKTRIVETYDMVMEQTIKNMEKFVWKNFLNPQELGVARMNAMNKFLDDYEMGLQENRYIEGSLPKINFDNDKFDLALSSHFLFLYTDNLSYEFHIEAIEEMLRVAKEIRIFPIVNNNAIKSDYYDKAVNFFKGKGCKVSEQEVSYEMQKGGTKMLKICR